VSDSAQIAATAIPRLPRGVRLQHDQVRGAWLLLGPERVMKPDPIAVEILRRCTGEATVEAIVADLARTFAVDAGTVGKDVRSFLGGLIEKRMIEIG
jgi:coenzyme PQQ biosynthesis protein PqqD